MKIVCKGIERVPYVRPVTQGVGIGMDTKETIESLLFQAAPLDGKTLNVLKNCSTARSKFLDELLEKGKSIDSENYNRIDFNSNSMINKD